MADDDDAWFAPKRYGYGAGLPIAWQGWVTLAVFVLMVVGPVILNTDFKTTAMIVFPGAIAFTILVATKTRGGWRWRWGDDG